MPGRFQPNWVAGFVRIARPICSESRRLANEEAAPCFAIVPVPLSASPQADMATAPEPLLVHVGDGFRIEIRGDFAAPVLEKLVRTLTRL